MLLSRFNARHCVELTIGLKFQVECFAVTVVRLIALLSCEQHAATVFDFDRCVQHVHGKALLIACW